MLAEEEVRLALRAHRDGRVGMRDSLLTLAVADAGAEGAAWAERCRRWLVSRRSDHLFARFPTLGEALADPRVLGSLERVRHTFPPVRVRHLLLRADALSGPYSGIRRPISDVLDSIFGKAHRRPVRFRATAPAWATAPARSSAGRLLVGPAPSGDQAVLILMAVFLSLALAGNDGRTRAA